MTIGTQSSQALQRKKLVKLELPEFFWSDFKIIQDNFDDFFNYRLKKLYGNNFYYYSRVYFLVKSLLFKPQIDNTVYWTEEEQKRFDKDILTYQTYVKEIIGNYRYDYGTNAKKEFIYKEDAFVPFYSFEEIIESDHWERWLNNKQIRSILCLL